MEIRITTPLGADPHKRSSPGFGSRRGERWPPPGFPRRAQGSQKWFLGPTVGLPGEARGRRWPRTLCSRLTCHEGRICQVEPAEAFWAGGRVPHQKPVAKKLSSEQPPHERETVDLQVSRRAPMERRANPRNHQFVAFVVPSLLHAQNSEAEEPKEIRIMFQKDRRHQDEEGRN